MLPSFTDERENLENSSLIMYLKSVYYCKVYFSNDSYSDSALFFKPNQLILSTVDCLAWNIFTKKIDRENGFTDDTSSQAANLDPQKLLASADFSPLNQHIKLRRKKGNPGTWIKGVSLIFDQYILMPSKIRFSVPFNTYTHDFSKS